MKKIISFLLALIMVLGLTACAGDKSQFDPESATWDQILAEAKGTTVTFYGWGGDENRNNWLNTTVADYVKENYDITLEVVGMNIDDILTKLSGEKMAGTRQGSIDMIWINGENFYSAKDNGLLYGPFTHKLPNMENYIDLTDPETMNDFCMPIDGYEAPYAKAQMVMYADTAVTPDLPASAEELLEVTMKGATKGGMVRHLADRLGISMEHVYCTGDEANDISMLTAAKEGFAPANCSAAVRACGATIVVHAEEGTIADIIRILDERY